MHRSLRLTPFTVCLGLLPLVLLFTGCGSSIDPQLLSQFRQQFVLADEPADPAAILDLQESLDEQRQVVVVGVIGGVTDPWTKGKASFIIVDPSCLHDAGEDHDHAHDHKGHDHKGHESKDHAHGGAGHDPATCPFCSKHEQDPHALALVEFLGPDGKVVPIDARQLFELKPQQLVVVKGIARKDATGHVIIAADGVHVRR